MTVGEKIRMLRSSRRLSLAEMSSLTGITKSMLSQVENNLTSPSITSLRRIAMALGAPMTAFFEEGVFQGQVVRKSSRKKIVFAGSAVIYEMLSPGSRMIEFLSVTLRPGAGTSDDLLTHGGEEVILVQTGEVTVLLGDESVSLSAEDSFGFEGSIAHRIVNSGNEPATFVMVICPPLY